MIAQIETCCKPSAFNRKARQRLVDSGSLPVTGPAITNMDLDLTVKCNLACDYCFKEKNKKEMSLKTARDAICWLIFASMDARRLQVNFIGGEPLLRFDLIKQLVPFAKRRASQHNKSI
ncbi:MAG: 4Fe-4S cluster-binding domain-containing protein, partial [Sedimentisphaerales bacterium]